MEPVKGGMLANPPESVTEILKAAEPESSPASWAIRFAANLPGVITVLSGMSSLAQMEDNLPAMRDFAGLTEAQSETIAKAQEALRAIPLRPCTTCNYCAKVCPSRVRNLTVERLQVFRNQAFDFFRVPHGADNGIALLQKLARHLVSETAADARNHPSSAHAARLLFVDSQLIPHAKAGINSDYLST